MNHIKHITHLLLALCLLVVFTGCGGKDEKTAQAAPEERLQASGGRETLLIQRSLEKPPVAPAADADPTEVDQGVVIGVEHAPLVSAEKRALAEKISKIDMELRIVEEELQGALFEVRQTDTECLKLSDQLREKNGQLANVLENHPARSLAQQNIQAMSAQLAAARAHFDEALQDAGPQRGRGGSDSSSICQVCAAHDAYKANDRIPHKQAATKWLSDAQKQYTDAVRGLSSTMENVQRNDPDVVRAVLDRNEVQSKLDARFESNPLTAGMLGRRKHLYAEKKDATSSWVKIITTTRIPSTKTGDGTSDIRTDS